MTGASYEEHVLQNNHRLLNIHHALNSCITFSGAARELIEWCGDSRAFQSHFEHNLIECVQTVFRLCSLDGFESELSLQLVKLCYEHRHLVSAESADLLASWYDDLCLRWTHTQHPTAVVSDQMHKGQSMVWNQPQQGAVSVVTTVYPGAVQSQYPNPGADYDNASYPTPPAYGAANTGYAPAYAKSQQGYPQPSSMYNPQMRQHPQYGQHMVAAAAVAGATAVATATAVAFDPQHMQQRQPAQYSAQQMHQQMPQYQAYNGYPPHNQHYMPAQRVLPNGYAPMRQSMPQPHPHQIMVGNGGRPAYPVRHMQSVPGRPAYPMNPAMVQSSLYDQIDMKPIMTTLKPRDDLVSYPIQNGVLLGDFRLDHAIMHPNVTTQQFELNPRMWSFLENPLLDVQLRCFHNDDPTQPNNWPVNQEQISVHASVNGQRQAFESASMPLYIKRFCKQGTNVLEISVMQCCCSHLFSLRLVERHPVNKLVAVFEGQKSIEINQSKEKIKRFLQSQPNESGGEVQNLSIKVSLIDPISRSVMEVPARGRECRHVQCFDLRMFCMINKEKAVWTCPVCSHPIRDNLEIDTYIKSLIHRTRGTPNTELMLDAHANILTFPDSKLNVRSPGDVCVSGPPVKRIKTEVGGGCGVWNNPNNAQPPPYPAASPANPYSNLSPYVQPQPRSPYVQPQPRSPYVQPQPRSPYVQPQPSPSKGPSTPRGYQPPTPVTPGAHGQGPSSVEPQTIQPELSQQTSQEGSMSGSAPYTPASVSSAGSLPPRGNTQELESFSSWDIDDLFQADSRDNQLLSEQELMKYLEEDRSWTRAPPGDNSTNAVLSVDAGVLLDEDFDSLINETYT